MSGDCSYMAYWQNPTYKCNEAQPSWQADRCDKVEDEAKAINIHYLFPASFLFSKQSLSNTQRDPCERSEKTFGPRRLLQMARSHLLAALAICLLAVASVALVAVLAVVFLLFVVVPTIQTAIITVLLSIFSRKHKSNEVGPYGSGRFKKCAM